MLLVYMIHPKLDSLRVLGSDFDAGDSAAADLNLTESDVFRVLFAQGGIAHVGHHGLGSHITGDGPSGSDISLCYPADHVIRKVPAFLQ